MSTKRSLLQQTKILNRARLNGFQAFPKVFGILAVMSLITMTGCGGPDVLPAPTATVTVTTAASSSTTPSAEAVASQAAVKAAAAARAEAVAKAKVAKAKAAKAKAAKAKAAKAKAAKAKARAASRKLDANARAACEVLAFNYQDVTTKQDRSNLARGVNAHARYSSNKDIVEAGEFLTDQVGSWTGFLWNGAVANFAELCSKG